MPSLIYKIIDPVSREKTNKFAKELNVKNKEEKKNRRLLWQILFRSIIFKIENTSILGNKVCIRTDF